MASGNKPQWMDLSLWNQRTFQPTTSPFDIIPVMPSEARHLKKEWKKYWKRYMKRNKYLIGGSVLSMGAMALIYYASKPRDVTTETKDEMKAIEMDNETPIIVSEPQKVIQSILDETLWADCDVDDKPLFRLSAHELCGVIGLWIKNDVDFNEKLQKMKCLFAKYRISGSVLSVIHMREKGDFKLIENILINHMARQFSPDTVSVMMKSMTQWMETADPQDLRAAVSDDVAQLIMQFPIWNLKEAVCDERVDGNRFIENPDFLSLQIVHKTTGWPSTECKLLNEVLLRRLSFMEQQILENVRRVAADQKLIEFRRDSVIEKLQDRLLSDCDLEALHYDLRTKAFVHPLFRRMIQKLMADMMKLQEMDQVDEDEFIAAFFDTLASAMIVHVDGDEMKGQMPWICLFCGNENVHKVIGYKLVTDISICSLCGFAQTESIAMGMKGIPMPFQSGRVDIEPVNDPNAATKEQESTAHDRDDVIEQELIDKQADMHCDTQPDAHLCRFVKRALVMLRTQRRYLLLMEGRKRGADKQMKLTAAELEAFVPLDAYRSAVVQAVDTVMEKKPNDKESVRKSVVKLLDDSVDGIGDHVDYFGDGANSQIINDKNPKKKMARGRKRFLKILRGNTKMNGGQVGNVFKAVKVTLEAMTKTTVPQHYQKWLCGIKLSEVMSISEHIDQKHLENASNSRKLSILSFFEGVMGCDNVIQCDNLSLDDASKAVHDALIDLYLTLCHHDDEADDEVEKKQINDVVPSQPRTPQDDADGKFWKYITEGNVTSYGFGVNHNYIHLSPRLTSIREELGYNDNGANFLKILKKAVQAFCVKLRGKSSALIAREYGAKHGILRNGNITMKHVFALLSYTDLTQFCIYMYLLIYVSLHIYT